MALLALAGAAQEQGARAGDQQAPAACFLRPTPEQIAHERSR
jgi:hypothetical protein